MSVVAFLSPNPRQGMIKTIVIVLGWILVISWMAGLVSNGEGFRKGLFLILSLILGLFLFVVSFSWLMVYLIPAISKSTIFQILLAILGFYLLCVVFGFGAVFGTLLIKKASSFLSSIRQKKK